MLVLVVEVHRDDLHLAEVVVVQRLAELLRPRGLSPRKSQIAHSGSHE